MVCLAACAGDQKPVDSLTRRLADKCGVDATGIHYAASPPSYGTTETYEWWANDASSNRPEFTLSRKMLPPLGWRLSCGTESAIPVSVSRAELQAAESSSH